MRTGGFEEALEEAKSFREKNPEDGLPPTDSAEIKATTPIPDGLDQTYALDK